MVALYYKGGLPLLLTGESSTWKNVFNVGGISFGWLMIYW
ncbi:SH3-like domain-containing protein [Enterococcus sp. UD-01]|jgi:SH3-like domain-containing protein